MEDVRGLQDRIDSRLHADDTGARPDRTVVVERQPSVTAAVLRRLLLVVLFFPSVVWFVIAARHVRYILERARVARESGVFFKRRYTVLLARIDHLTTSRGVVHRLTKTGTIGIRTLGSVGTDVAVADIREHKALYEKIESMTKKRVGQSRPH